jgi:hypothetical protein
VYVVVNNKEYKLSPADTSDNNYTDGKDYTTKLKFDQGTYIFFYKANTNNGTINSPSSTIFVRNIEQYTHMDVVYGVLTATVIVLIPLVYAIYLLRKIVILKYKNKSESSTDDRVPKTKSRK